MLSRHRFNVPSVPGGIKMGLGATKAPWALEQAHPSPIFGTCPILNPCAIGSLGTLGALGGYCAMPPPPTCDFEQDSGSSLLDYQRPQVAQPAVRPKSFTIGATAGTPSNTCFHCFLGLPTCPVYLRDARGGKRAANGEKCRRGRLV